MNNLDSQLVDVKSAAISGHVRPDGDCVGSTLAVYNYIKTYYPKITVDIYLDSIPTIFEFLENADQIQQERPDDRTYDLFFSLDCGDLSRLGDSAKYFTTAKKTVCIDHHVSNQSFADENYIFPHVGSSSELVFDLIGEEKLTMEIAECIYTGMVHDTGVFQYSSTTAKTMNIAGKLMETGIDFTKIVDETFYTKSFAQNKILGKTLKDSYLLLEGRLIVGVVSKQDMEEYKVLPKHLDGIVNQLRVTKGVEVALFLYEADDGYKVSMRSNGLVDVAKIAVNFGGGGHVRAAGCTIAGDLSAVVQKIADEIELQI